MALLRPERTAIVVGVRTAVTTSAAIRVRASSRTAQLAMIRMMTAVFHASLPQPTTSAAPAPVNVTLKRNALAILALAQRIPIKKMETVVVTTILA
jgi:hypothetical protein